MDTADPLPGRESPGHPAPEDRGRLLPRSHQSGFVQGGRGSRAGADEAGPGGSFSSLPGRRRWLSLPANRSGNDDRLPKKGKDQAAPPRAGARGLPPRPAGELPPTPSRKHPEPGLARPVPADSPTSRQAGGVGSACRRTVAGPTIACRRRGKIRPHLPDREAVSRTPPREASRNTAPPDRERGPTSTTGSGASAAPGAERGGG